MAAAGLAGAAPSAYAAGVEVRWFALRRVTLPVLPAGHATAAGAAPLRPAPDAGPGPQARLGARRWPTWSPTWWSTPATTSPTSTVGAAGARRPRRRCSTCPASSCSAPTTTSRRRCATRCATCCPTTASATPTRRSCRDGTSATASSSAGWIDLTNRREHAHRAGTTFAFAGVDDPHLEYDDLAAVAGPADAGADLRVGVTHAPYLRVLDQFAADGYDAVLAGHTHGGQVCLPVYGALVTNCDLDAGPGQGAAPAPGGRRARATPGSSWLHVSAGLGTSPYAPVRFACRPEATLLTLLTTPISAGRVARYRCRAAARLE